MNSEAQINRRPIEELINKTDSGWPLVTAWMDSATHQVEALPRDAEQARLALFQTQVTTRSPMGAVVYETGGILIDSGWIRILGSGHARLQRTLPGWNNATGNTSENQVPKALLIADDAIGGFFILNGGALGSDLGKVYYFAPDHLDYESLDLSYTGFLQFCFNGDHDKFYKGLRWSNWREDVTDLPGDKVFNFYPPLWSVEGKDIEKASRKVIPVAEQYQLNLDFRKQLGQGRTAADRRLELPLP